MTTRLTLVFTLELVRSLIGSKKPYVLAKGNFVSNPRLARSARSAGLPSQSILILASPCLLHLRQFLGLHTLLGPLGIIISPFLQQPPVLHTLLGPLGIISSLLIPLGCQPQHLPSLERKNKFIIESFRVVVYRFGSNNQ